MSEDRTMTDEELIDKIDDFISDWEDVKFKLEDLPLQRDIIECEIDNNELEKKAKFKRLKDAIKDFKRYIKEFENFF
jgi:tRNA(Ser,Leu) C12 N-acetylase TAN1